VSDTPLTVRRAGARDRAELARLLSDMQAHYDSPDPPGGALEMARLLTRQGERMPFALLAEHAGKAVGLATLNPVLFGGAFQWLLWLKDLYVTAEARSLGVGRVLMAEMARVALAEGYVRIDWTTDESNAGAQRFYDGLAIPRQDKVYYRLSGDDLRKLATP
jgi:GNAT superfamily N-acetyltransferase